MNDFEQRLQRVPLKPVPPGWRAEILAAAAAVPSAPKESARPSFGSWLHALLWPHPKAWAGLAAVWLFIALLNFSQRGTAPVRAEKSAAPTPAAVAELRQQHELLVELLGRPEPRDADRPRSTVPQPRARAMQILIG